MSRTELLLSPTPPSAEVLASGHPATGAKGCRFASNCNCVFAPAEPAQPATASRDTITEIEAEVAVLLQRGWRVASADEHTVVLTRRRSMPFCTNVALLLVTGFLWSIYLVVRAKHPKIETTTLTY